MNLEQQVCLLELAKQLKELGVKQRSIFYHITFINTSSARYDKNNEQVWNDIIGEDEWDDYKERSYLKKLRRYSAFTVAELGEMLPTQFYWEDSAEYVYLRIEKYPDYYKLSYFDHDDKWFDWYSIEDVSEANARAKMLIHLLENKLMELPE